MAMLKFFVWLPAVFAALPVKLYVPAVVGVPEINPVLAVKLKPFGKLPFEIDQVIGVDPLDIRICL